MSGSNSRVDEAVKGLIEAMAGAAAAAKGNNNSNSSNKGGNIISNSTTCNTSTTSTNGWVDDTLDRVRVGVLAILRRRARADRLRPELRQKIVNWLISFHRLDPRYKILTFFNLVASEGADELVNEEDDDTLTDDLLESTTSRRSSTSFTKVERMLRDAFSTTSILTVWRPCRNDAVRKMMEGSGVGKGLDIKGKSALRGDLSGYVPFLQIYEEHHKSAVSKIGRKAKMRVYYSSRKARDAVIEELEPHGNDYMEFDPSKVIPSGMVEIDRYASKGYYGLELYQRLFWQGYVLEQNIERKQDGTATGRSSIPGFQDANLKTLKVATEAKPPPSPMPVVYQVSCCRSARFF